MTKKQRLNRILELIEEFEIDTQEELTERLNNEGYKISQATISRDINELFIVKGAGNKKKFKYVKASNPDDKISPKILELFKHVTLSIVSANNLIVIKTLSGNAGAAGMAIDAMNFPQILGSVAGDDTLLVVVRNNEEAEMVVKSLRKL